MLDLQYEYTCAACRYRYASEEDVHATGCCAGRVIATDDPNFGVSRHEDYHEYPELGDWVIERLLGQGGQAFTYRVRHVDAQDQTKFVAKVLKPWTPGGKQASAEDHAGRFLREVSALAALASSGCPRIVPVVDSRLTPKDGALWYVMPFYAGGTLAAQAERFRGDIDRALRDVGLIAETLAWMHASTPQYVHRDVHADNVFYVTPDAEPVLGDFGLVHVREAAPTRITGDREPFGPWRWRPPELNPGSADKTLPASDVYLLGGVLYEALTGGGEHIENTQNAHGAFVHERPEFSIGRFTSDPRVTRVERLLRSMLARDPRANVSTGGRACLRRYPCRG